MGRCPPRPWASRLPREAQNHIPAVFHVARCELCGRGGEEDQDGEGPAQSSDAGIRQIHSASPLAWRDLHDHECL